VGVGTGRDVIDPLPTWQLGDDGGCSFFNCSNKLLFFSSAALQPVHVGLAFHLEKQL
jgi:hypothetical protein